MNLQDTLRSRAPEVAFENPWEATDPVRMVHLLEHTSGWDELTPSAGNWDPAPEPARGAALARFSGSRTSRWRPGTRFAYTNLGPDVAAYVVEKVVGEPFEHYVARTWFQPLGMTGAAYLDGSETRVNLATAYRMGGGVAEPHFNVLTRPAGAIVASPRDMANLVEFFLSRGSFRGKRLLPAEAIDRMERPTSTYAAAAGQAIGYGLGNATSVWRNWVFHGHGGSVPGALSEMNYLPDQGVGYALMINQENYGAMDRLTQVVRAYLVQGLAAPGPMPTAAVDEAELARFAGWYEPITPRNESARFLEGFLGLTRLGARDGRLYLRDLTNGTYAYLRGGPRLYRRLDGSRSLVLVEDRREGTLFQTVGGPTFRRLPAYWVDLKLGFVVATLGLMVSTAIFAFFWLPRRLFGDLKAAPFFGVRMDPLWATLWGAAVGFLIWNASGDYYARAGGAVWTGGWVLFANHMAHGLFAFFAIRGLARAMRRRRSPIGRAIWWHSFATSLALTVWAVSLSYWGLRSEFG